MKQNKSYAVKELFDNLKVSQTLAEQILDLLKDENKAITAMNIKELVSLTSQKESLLAKIHYVDRRVMDIIEELTEAQESKSQKNPKKQETKTKKLDDIAALMPEEQKRTILQYHKNLAKYRQEIYTRNLINKRYTSDTLLCINDAISLITEQPAKTDIYSSKGVTSYANQNPAMISREV